MILFDIFAILSEMCVQGVRELQQGQEALSLWGTYPAWATACIAMVAAIIGVRQLRLATAAQVAQLKQLELATKAQAAQAKQLELATKAQADQVQIARANLMLTIDKTYEGDEMLRSRKAVRSLRNRAEASVESQGHKDKSTDGRRKQIAEEFSDQMDALWRIAKSLSDEDVEDAKSKQRIAHDRYSELMGLVNWMETVGMLCKRNLLPTVDILDLYDQVIVPTMTNFKNHIEVRRNEQPYANKRFMENAYWLLEKSQAYQLERDRTIPSDPAASSTKWD